MLPFDDKKKPLVVGSGEDLESAAKTTAIRRFMDAMKGGDAEKAADAMASFMALCESDKY